MGFLKLIFPLLLILPSCGSITHISNITPRISPLKTEIVCARTLIYDQGTRTMAPGQIEAIYGVLNQFGYLVATLCDDQMKRVDIKISPLRGYLASNEEIKAIWNVHSIISLTTIPLYNEMMNRLVVTDENGIELVNATFKISAISSWLLLPMTLISDDVYFFETINRREFHFYFGQRSE